MGTFIARYSWIAAALAVAAAAGFLVTLDLIEDPDSSLGDVVLNLLEEAPLVATTVAVVLLVQAAWRQRAALHHTSSALKSAIAAGLHWRRQAENHTAGLRAALEKQFNDWALSTAEQEVALLLLKGLSTKEVATTRSTSERTAREQARAVYAKAKLAGRAELAAFFLEDLLAPASAEASR